MPDCSTPVYCLEGAKHRTLRSSRHSWWCRCFTLKNSALHAKSKHPLSVCPLGSQNTSCWAWHLKKKKSSMGNISLPKRRIERNWQQRFSIKTTQPNHSTVKLTVNSPRSCSWNSKSASECPALTRENCQTLEESVQHGKCRTKKNPCSSPNPSHKATRLRRWFAENRRLRYRQLFITVIREIKYKCNHAMRIRDYFLKEGRRC